MTTTTETTLPSTVCSTHISEQHWHPTIMPVIEWFNRLTQEQQNIVRPDIQAMNGALRMLEAPDF